MTVSLCVSGGNLKINGWDRNEVRVFVNEGSAIGFKVLENDKKSQLPAWIMILGFDPKKAAGSGQECLSGDEIEIDLPRNAAAKLKNEETKVSVNSIRKIVIQNLVGDILLNNISEGIQAVTYEGDIIVEKSEGAMATAKRHGKHFRVRCQSERNRRRFQSENQQRRDFPASYRTSSTRNKYQFRLDQIYGRNPQ